MEYEKTLSEGMEFLRLIRAEHMTEVFVRHDQGGKRYSYLNSQLMYRAWYCRHDVRIDADDDLPCTFIEQQIEKLIAAELWDRCVPFVSGTIQEIGLTPSRCMKFTKIFSTYEQYEQLYEGVPAQKRLEECFDHWKELLFIPKD